MSMHLFVIESPLADLGYALCMVTSVASILELKPTLAIDFICAHECRSKWTEIYQ